MSNADVGSWVVFSVGSVGGKKESEQRKEDKSEESMLRNYERALSIKRSFDSCASKCPNL